MFVCNYNYRFVLGLVYLFCILGWDIIFIYYMFLDFFLKKNNFSLVATFFFRCFCSVFCCFASYICLSSSVFFDRAVLRLILFILIFFYILFFCINALFGLLYFLFKEILGLAVIYILGINLVPGTGPNRLETDPTQYILRCWAVRVVPWEPSTGFCARRMLLLNS